MYFSDLSRAFGVIEAQTSRIEITKVLAELFNLSTPDEVQIICYLSLGLMRANYKGTQFNFAEKNIKKVIAKVLDISAREVSKRVNKLGDLGTLVVEGSWVVEKQLTVMEVHEKLSEFEAISGTGSQEEKIRIFGKLLRALEPLSACYVIRIVLKKLRLGFSEMTLVDALSWSITRNKTLRERIEHAYNISADIGMIARLLKEGGMEAIDKIDITVGIPIRAAAAERLPSAAAIVKKIGKCVAQPKFDGFRLQVHVDKQTREPKFFFFSRNMLDMSQMFPDLLKVIEDLPVKTLIVEGEALAYDEQTGSYLPFQETVKRRRKYSIERMAADIPLKLILFDILFMDGTSFLGYSHRERREILMKLFDRFPSEKIFVTEEVEVSTKEELEDYFTKSISLGLEGLVVKKLSAPYQPGKRNFNWIKLKRQEGGQLEDTIDVVIIGYYYGKGKRASFGIGAFLVGVYNKQKDVFETIAKIGTGLSDVGWIELKDMCDRIQIERPMHNVICSKELVPDVWVVPELVVLVRADEITKSPVHSAGKDGKHLGFALRFPRFMGYRTDKASFEATTVEEIKTLFKHQAVRR